MIWNIRVYIKSKSKIRSDFDSFISSLLFYFYKIWFLYFKNFSNINFLSNSISNILIFMKLSQEYFQTFEFFVLFSFNVLKNRDSILKL